jgi:flagellar assembly factor FliW
MSDPTPLSVIAFPDGLPGFETCHRFVLVHPPGLGPFTIVQHADGPLPAFVTIDPLDVHGGYRTELTDADRARLGAAGETPLLWLAMVSTRDDGKPTVNLRAPLVINPATMTGLQVISAESPYSRAHPLRAA